MKTFYIFLSLLLIFVYLGASGKKKPASKSSDSKNSDVDNFDPFDLREQMLIEDDVIHLELIQYPDEGSFPKELKNIKQIVLLPLQIGVGGADGEINGGPIAKAAIDQVEKEILRQISLGGKYKISQDAAIADNKTAFISGIVWVDYQIEDKNWIFKNKVAYNSSSKEIIQSIPYKEFSGFLKVSLRIFAKNTTENLSDLDLNKSAQRKLVIASHTDSKAFKIRFEKSRNFKQSYKDTKNTHQESAKLLEVDESVLKGLDLSQWIVGKFIQKISPYPNKIKVKMFSPYNSRVKNNEFFNNIMENKMNLVKPIIQKQSSQKRDYNLGVLAELSGDIPLAKKYYESVFLKNSLPSSDLYYESLKRIAFYDNKRIAPLPSK